MCACVRACVRVCVCACMRVRVRVVPSQSHGCSLNSHKVLMCAASVAPRVPLTIAAPPCRPAWLRMAPANSAPLQCGRASARNCPTAEAPRTCSSAPPHPCPPRPCPLCLCPLCRRCLCRTVGMPQRRHWPAIPMRNSNQKCRGWSAFATDPGFETRFAPSTSLRKHISNYDCWHHFETHINGAM